jgi:ABC-type bacteriocin/lantibiotic exporter with double-glycine peptidase domain
MHANFPRIMLTVPFIAQRRTGECLVACAAMALAYLGQQPDYALLARRLSVTQIGAPFPNLRVLANLNVRVLVDYGTLDVLHQQLSRGYPCIVSIQTGQLPHWFGEDFAHAAVMVGRNAGHVYLHDPAVLVYPLRVSIGDFDLAWLERDEQYAVLLPA